ncbi:MAG: hypothetical protein KUG72_08450 [Pseudomonadales bacterium]|nr:hypothetical protein [Pseudomonadales bacterium]
MSDKFPGQSDGETEQNKVVDQSINSTDQALNPSRRKFAKAGVIAPAILTVSARPAFANMCSISGGGSPGSNSVVEPKCEGCSHGFYKKHAGKWPLGASAGTKYKVKILDTNPVKTKKVYVNDGTKFDEVFPGGQGNLLGGVGPILVTTLDGEHSIPTKGDYYELSGGDTGISLMQVMRLSPSEGDTPLKVAFAIQLVAALLNAHHDTVNYGYSAVEIIGLYNEAMAGNFPVEAPSLKKLKKVLDEMNNRYCPF